MSDPAAAESILVVDDEPQLRQLLVDALDRPGLRVYAAASGQEAIAMAQRHQPAVLVTDLLLGDCSGLEVIDRLRSARRDLPTVVITGCCDPATLDQASRRAPLDLLTKPLDIERLRRSVWAEVARHSRTCALSARHQRLRRMARLIRTRERSASAAPDAGCPRCRQHDEQLANYRMVMEYQQSLLCARTDDDVFRSFFSLFSRKAGAVYGIASVCDAEAQLQVTGRFGVPLPDNAAFSGRLNKPIVDLVLTDPRCQILDAYDQRKSFDPIIQRYLPGVSVLALPLIPKPGELIGLITLYRKGEQPFSPADLKLAELLMTPTALAVQRND